LPYYCEVCLPIAWRAGLGSWGLAGKRPAPRTPPQASIVRTARLPGYPCFLRPARQAIDGRTLRSSIRLFLRINISLTIEKTYKIVENLSTQFLLTSK